MDVQPGQDAATTIGASEETGGPLVDPPKARIVTLRLVASEDEAECGFWVGLARKGTGEPPALMDIDEIGAVFERAAQEGLVDEGPVMLSDSRRVPPRYIYLLPLPPKDFRDRVVWLGELTQTVRSWNPKGAGFYLSAELMESADANELLLQVLRELIRNSETSDYYLLLGEHGMNSLLNSALRLKTELEPDGVDLLVFH